MEFEHFTAISFDCYGTLIDWESGILPVIRALLTGDGQSLADSAILELYGEFEAEAESGPYRSYRDVLEAVVRAFADRFHFEAAPKKSGHCTNRTGVAAFCGHGACAARTTEALQVAVISNIDDSLFAETRKNLGVEFEVVVTAEQAGSYKPSINNFQMAQHRLAIAPDRLLHVGQSVYHDVVPARALGIATVW